MVSIAANHVTCLPVTLAYTGASHLHIHSALDDFATGTCLKTTSVTPQVLTNSFTDI